MKEFDNLKEIWNQQKESSVPDVSQIISKAKKEKQTMGNKMILQIGILLSTIVALIWVTSSIDFKMITTFIGIGLMLFTIFAFSLIRLYQLYKLKKIDLTQSPKKVLIQLEQFYTFLKLVSTKGALTYFILLNLAFVFYFIEVMAPMSTLMKVIVLTLYTAWMLFAYFILGKKQKQKEYDKIEAIINSIKKVENEYEQ